jgi:phosphate ABC transporter phosphate-binding protein
VRLYRRASRLAVVVLVATMASVVGIRPSTAALAGTFVPISGAGSTWSQNAVNAWTANVAQYGMVVTYNGVGSTTGRSYFRQGTVDWAASDIPYGVKDGISDDPLPTSRTFAYMPITAGGTVFMYNLKIGNSRVTNLRLSGPVIAGIFTGTITKWDDPAIAADNPGLTLPGLTIVPVARSDGSGSTAQFTQWMVATQGGAWTAYCAKVGRTPCTQTSAYPILPGSHMVGQAGDLGVAGYVSQAGAVGSIGYVEYSYAIQSGFPAAKVLNAGGYYTEPTPGHVAVALLQAHINQDKSNPATYLTQDLSGVYVDTDPRAYPLSSYSYMILPTDGNFDFNTNKGYTLGEFGKYLLCQGQAQVDALGYSALPINLVQAGYEQLAKVSGADIPASLAAQIQTCNNPTFSTDGTNTLANTDPYPPDCDKHGPTQCATGTGGAKASTPVSGGGIGSGGGQTAGPSGSAVPATSGNASNGPLDACDPSSGLCEAAGGGGVQNAVGVPVSTSAGLGDIAGIVLMAIAAALLVGLVVAPPLLARASAKRRVRRDQAEE